MTIIGSCSARFGDVKAEFERNFAERGEIGASVHVTVDGESVVDLVGGIADPDTDRPWTEDTIALAWSCTKGATALCAHILAERGAIDFDAPVAQYWPEFGQAGKESITVRMLLSHQAGVPALREFLPPDAAMDWEGMVGRLETEEPFWEPGTRHGYHGFTFGWLVGEVIRRVSGRTPGRFFAEEVAEPLKLDFWIGLPKVQEGRVAPNLSADFPPPNAPISPVHMLALSDPASIPALIFFNSGGILENPNSPAFRAAEIPAANGITNGRGLALMYRPLALGGSADGVKLVGPDSIARMVRVESASAIDAGVHMPTRFSLGYWKSFDHTDRGTGVRETAAMGETAFGHPGAGGAIGFADPEARLSFGYVMNKQGPFMVNQRGQSLIDAVYRALGYRSRESGCWTR